MAKATRVRGIRPKESMTENARRVIETRVADLLHFGPSLDDASLVPELHDLRIAAKRLRYSLEIFELCFPPVKPLREELVQLQEDVGTIHDLDVLVEIMRERLTAIETPVEEEAVQVMESDLDPREKSNGLRRVLYRQARDRRRLGLLGLIGDKVALRRRLYRELQDQWGGGRLHAFADQIRAAVAEPAAAQTDAGDTARSA